MIMGSNAVNKSIFVFVSGYIQLTTFVLMRTRSLQQQDLHRLLVYKQHRASSGGTLWARVDQQSGIGPSPVAPPGWQAARLLEADPALHCSSTCSSHA